MVKVEVKKEYCWKIAAKKFGKDAVIVLLSGLIVVWQDDARYVALIPIIKSGLNYLKYK